ncbi:MAG: PQQ-like beta-propeller repeat protein [Planctomycetaceae bacterium]|nr:PQQ-like beta-propeller repeat protein [Planctomycetaceae bacterium]
MIAVLTLSMVAVAIVVLNSGFDESADSVSQSPSSVAELSTEPERLEGWTTLFGPRHDSISREKHVRTSWPASGPPILWRVAIGTGYSSPVAMDDHVYLLHRSGDEELVEAFHIETGASVWRQAYPTAYHCKFDYSHGPYATPAIDGEHIYTYGAEGVLHCLARTSGQVVWSRTLNRDYEVPEGLFGASSSPLVEGDRVILSIGGGAREAAIVAVDKRTGETLWTCIKDGAGYATARAATIHGRRLVFAMTESYFVALDPSDGRVYWQIPFRSKSPDACNATSPLVVGDLALATTGPGPGSLCVRVLPDGSHETVWSDRRVLDSTWNTLVHLDGHVYGFSSKRLRAGLRCVELATGQLRWSHESELERGAMLAVDGHLLVLGEFGHLASLALSPQAAKVVAQTAEPLLERPCYSAPALHRGILFVRNERELLALDLRAANAEVP